MDFLHQQLVDHYGKDTDLPYIILYNTVTGELGSPTQVFDEENQRSYANMIIGYWLTQSGVEVQSIKVYANFPFEVQIAIVQ